MSRFLELLRDSPVLPAPMCGFSDRAARAIAREHGAHLVYTQMVSAEGLVRDDRKTWRLTDIEGEAPPVAVQIFGARPESAAEAARIVEGRGAAVVDFNIGCPARKVVDNEGGSALLRQPERVARIVRAVVAAVSIPFTVKMRWDWDETGRAALEIARICEAEGAAGVCLHARTRAAQYQGRADWARIGELKAALRVPVIGNGDIRTDADALAMMRQTGCDAVMIGRGILGAPWLIGACLRAIQRGEALGVDGRPATVEERLAIMRRHAQEMVRRRGDEARALREFRKIAAAYLRSLPHSRAMRNELMRVETLEELDKVLETGGFREREMNRG
ncbi:MAG: tRNA dihydrouridine synthase DusB [Candidatus Sumerlaeota bacterium]|nr:tRNA dihydrouridine synthase DusB [Candidatus Sumerlaeota bacterium]